MNPDKIKNLFNIVGFQASWWGCILGAKYGLEYIGPILMFGFLVTHFLYFTKVNNELYLVLIFAIIGTAIDSLFIVSGIFDYMGLYFEGVLIAPLWITAMWCGFVATVNHSLSWFKGRWVAASILGVYGGPVSYIVGEKFNAIIFLDEFYKTNLILAIVWGLSIPLIYYVNEKLVLD